MLEGHHFALFTDHKPLTQALFRSSDPWTPRQCRQLSYIAEYTSDIQHIAGEENIVADTLSRPTTVQQVPPTAAASCVKLPPGYRRPPADEEASQSPLQMQSSPRWLPSTAAWISAP